MNNPAVVTNPQLGIMMSAPASRNALAHIGTCSNTGAGKGGTTIIVTRNASHTVFLRDAHLTRANHRKSRRTRSSSPTLAWRCRQPTAQLGSPALETATGFLVNRHTCHCNARSSSVATHWQHIQSNGKHEKWPTHNDGHTQLTHRRRFVYGVMNCDKRYPCATCTCTASKPHVCTAVAAAFANAEVTRAMSS